MTTITKISSESLDFYLYERIIELLYEIKLARGNDFLNSTIRRHKKISNFLTKYQKNYLKYLEDCLDDNSEIISSKFKSLHY